MGEVPFAQARSLRMGERDSELGLADARWPRASAAGWDSGDGYLHRVIGMERQGPDREEVRLDERLLRFPSAPIHGLHRLSQMHVNMGPVESFHGCRLLSHPGRRGKVSRIFLMHNGLNETQKIGLYYQLASYLIEQDPATVCLLRPFPGHLSRSPYPGLAETPLDHYLWDGLHLFRQFLRYMIETRWLLSTIARYSYYHCVSGSGLLGQNLRIAGSRLAPDHLAAEMEREWSELATASREAIAAQEADSPKMPDVPRRRSFKQAIVALQDALRLDRYRKQDGSSFVSSGEPELHVVGYSLGGFMAQSVFMSWAFMVSSCSTLLSGGALRELAPTAFADPEEWQTVLHSLRYELDDAMMDWRFSQESDGDLVAGMEPTLFRYLKRTFYEVFEQEYRGSFQTRLAAFRQRMLFVVGGDDPIVRPQSVLDAGPPDGINLIAVGGLGHFLEGVARGKLEQEQRTFWLPEIGRTIGRLAGDAAKKHRGKLRQTWLDEDDLIREPKSRRRRKSGIWKDLERLSIAERLEIERDGTLPNQLFQAALDDLLVRAVSEEEHPGLLFILKNEPPTFLLEKRALQQRGSAMYHEDVSIVDYVRAVQLRREVIYEEGRDRICLLLPSNLPTILSKIDAETQHPSQSESSGEQVRLPGDAAQSWPDLAGLCRESTGDEHADWIRVFDGSKDEAGRQLPDPASRADPEPLSEFARTLLKVDDPTTPVIPALPDCWVWMSNEFFRSADEEPPPIGDAIEQLGRLVPNRYLGAANEALVGEMLRSDALRMVTISRARYNPRFRGRIIAEPRQAQELLLRVALCIVTSVGFGNFEFGEA